MTVKHGGHRPGAGRPKAINSDALKQVREALGKSQEAMARELGCTFAAYGNMERGQRLPTKADVLARFKQLAATVGVEVPELKGSQ